MGQKLTLHKMLTAGYTYQNLHLAELGGKILLLKNDDVIYRLGLSGLLGVPQGKIAIMPKFQGEILFNFERNVDFYHAYYLTIGSEVTTYYIAPSAGVTLFGLLDLRGGYAFPIYNDTWYGKQMKGLNISASFNIPLVVFGKK